MKALTLLFLTFGVCSSATNASAEELTKADADVLVANMGNWTELIIQSKYTKLQGGVFKGCDKIHSVKFLGEVKNIHYEMFNKCSNLHTVMLPEGVEIIGRDAFGECTALKNMNFHVSVRLIDEYAFNKTALEEITL